MSLSTKARHVHRILPHPGEHPSEPNSFGGFEPATTLPRRTDQVASALHESMWQYHKYRSLYVRPELRCNESGAHFCPHLSTPSFHFSRSRVSISNRTRPGRSLYCGLAIAAFYERVVPVHPAGHRFTEPSV